MTEHFPKSTLTATAWCARCGKSTEHQIDDGRVGRCLDEGHPTPPIPKAVIPKLDLPKQADLFGQPNGAPQVMEWNCPHCRAVFTHPSADGVPEWCPFCGANLTGHGSRATGHGL